MSVDDVDAAERFYGNALGLRKLFRFDLWMAFFRDPAGNTLALMQEAPKGYQPAP